MKNKYNIVICLFLILNCPLIYGATKTWTGTTSTSWADGSNWGGTPPVSGDVVNIPTVASGNYPIISTTVALGAGSVNINSNSGAGASLTLNSGGSLTTTGLITVLTAGTFTVSGGTASLAGITSSGTINVQGGTITSSGSITVSSGTLSQSGGLIHMAANTGTNPTDNLVINGGIVTQSGGTFYEKDFAPTAGTFNQTGSTAIFRIFHDWKPASGHTFNSASGTVQYSGSSGAAASFTSTNSQFNNIIIDASVNPGFDNAASSTIKLSGDLTNNNSGLINGTKATFSFNGTGSQNITSSSANFFANMTVNKSAGLISLASNITITGTLNMTAGNISTGANILTLGTSTVNRGTFTYTSGVFITGSTGGFKRWFINASVSNRVFPVGTSITNNSVTFSYTSAPTTGGTLTARFIPSDPGSNSATPINDAGYSVSTYSSIGYWQIDAGDGLTGGIYSVALRGQGFNPTGIEITNYPNLRVLLRSGPGVDWTAGGLHIVATGTNNDPSIQRGNLSALGQFAMGGNAPDGNPLQGPLPVELTQFSSSVNANSVVLNWVTESEKNNKGFDIFRKDINSGWQKIGFVDSKGNGNTHNMYSYSDINLSSSTYYYKLKQIDFNGNYKFYSLNAPVIIGIPAKFELKQNYPNPFNPSTTIQYSIPADANVELKIFDVSGKEIASLVNSKQNAGIYTVSFNASLYNMASGVYFYKVTAGKYTNVKKLMLIR
jgi:hypothetical protein